MAIEHIVVLMLENNSFDRMLGDLLPPRQTPGSPGGGLKGAAGQYWNVDHTTGVKYSTAITSAREMPEDPGHELDDVLSQIANGNSGFVANFANKYSKSPATERQEIMNCYGEGTLSVLHALAKNFTICDRWFSSMPGPTWPNRLFFYSGTSLGFTDMNSIHHWDQETLFDQLSTHGVSWKLYYGDVSSTYILQHKPDHANMYRLRNFYLDVKGPPGKFPSFAFIEPAYFTSPTDQHPPHDVNRGEALISEVYNALRANDALWQKTLLVVTYDEHGGFYDHIHPPAATPPDNKHDGSGFGFDIYGVRVPAVLVSPWLDPGVLIDTFDHTSAVRFILENNGLATDKLGARVATANSFGAHLRSTPRDTANVLPNIPVPSFLPPQEQAELSDLQEALADMTRMLAAQIEDKSVSTPLLRRAGTPYGEMQLSIDRFEAFLLDQAKKQ